MKRALALGSILLIPAALLLGGCYTILKHPAVSDSESGSEPQIVGRANRCSACHSNAEMQAIDYGAHHGYYPDPAWDRFYLWPWWYDDYSAYHGGGGGTGSPPQIRHEEGAGSLNTRPPVPRGVRGVAPPPATEKPPESKKDQEPPAGDPAKKENTDTSPKKHTEGEGTSNTRPPRPRP